METKPDTKMFEDLVKAQSEIGAVLKDQTNPFFKSKYVDINGLLAVVKPVLNKNNFALLQILTNLECRPAMKTLLVHSSGSMLGGEVFPIPESTKVQDLGSAITYIRRYSLQSILAIEAEDDDGNIASTPAKTEKKTFRKVKYPTAESEGIDPNKPPFEDEAPKVKLKEEAGDDLDFIGAGK